MSGHRVSLQRFRDAENAREEAQVWLEASQVSAQQGNLDAARSLLRDAVEADPDCAEAWLRLAHLAEEPRQRKALLQQVLALDPEHPQARVELARLQVPAPPSPVTPGVSPKRTRRWVLGALVLVVALLVLAILAWGPVDRSLAGLLSTPTPTPTPAPTLTPGQIAAQFEPRLQAALSGQDWDRALEIVAIMQSVDPAGEEVQRWAESARMQYGQSLVQAGQMAEALQQFDQAVNMVPGDGEAELWQRVTRLYLDGQEALAAGDWPTAIQILTQAHEQMPDYGDLATRIVEAYRLQGQAALDAEDWTLAIRSLSQARERSLEDPDLAALLSMAYRQRGIAWQEEGDLESAREDLEAALALQPDDDEARLHYDEVMYILFPPKRIEINISTQRFYAWQGDELIYEFPTSTGLPGQDTAPGNFEVQSKIPVAYSSVWNLTMPYWLGIYYVDDIENGIHALPIRPDGTVMWGGFLGQRASYGCVILSTEAAQLIYEWADIGTPVDIHY
jgi:tetratricopeptide (TPR) repeat protein